MEMFEGEFLEYLSPDGVCQGGQTSDAAHIVNHEQDVYPDGAAMSGLCMPFGKSVVGTETSYSVPQEYARYIEASNKQLHADSSPNIELQDINSVEVSSTTIKSQNVASPKRGNVKGSSSQSDSDSAADKKNKIRASVAKASRKIRMKRKLERENLLKRNQELEEEQEMFRIQIGELQLQMRNLRNNPEGDLGRVDLQSENILLRQQVKRHKTFINRLKCILNEGEGLRLNLPHEDKIKITNNGIESAVGQVLGMCYTSVLDDSWEIVEYYPKAKSLRGLKIVCRYQLLPIGSSPETATRINIRKETYNVPLCVTQQLRKKMAEEKIVEQLKYMKMFEKTHRKDSTVPQRDIEIEELDLGFKSLTLSGLENKNVNGEHDKSVQVVAPFKLLSFKLSGKDEDISEEKQSDILITFQSNVERNMNSWGFPDLLEASNASQNSATPKRNQIKAHIFVHTQAPGSLMEQSHDSASSKNYEGDNFLDSFIFRDSVGGDGTTWTNISSYPLDSRATCVRLAHAKLVSLLKDTSITAQEKMPKYLAFECKNIDKFFESVL